MKNFLLAAAFGATALTATSSNVNAQFDYNFSTFVQPYTPLANATSVNNGAIWYDTSNFIIPVGFQFKLGNFNVSSIILREANFATNVSNTIVSGIGVISATIQDRNVGKTTSASPISYTTTGTPGSRIFKFEVANAGFYDEMQYNTDDDYLNYQVWFYESNNAYEVRFGGSHITHFRDYFGNRIMTGFMKNLDINTDLFDRIYILNGSSSNPTVDSMPPQSLSKGLLDMPVSGTVYRFVPKNATTGIGEIARATLGRIYPTRTIGELVVESEKATHYDIVSYSGSVVKRGSIRNKKENIFLNELTAGNYLIRLYGDNNERDVQKFIVEN